MFDWRTKSDKEIVKFIEQQQSRLEKIRKPYEPLMDLVTKHFLPRTYDMGKTRAPGDAYGISIYNQTAADSVRKFGYGFTSATVSRDEGNEAWLNFVPLKQSALEIDNIKKYMQEAAEQVRFGFNQSTFYGQNAFLQQVQDASVLWGPMSCRRDLKKDRLVFTRRDPRDHWFGLDMFGDIDVDHFKVKMTAKQIVEQFEDDKIQQKIKDDVEKNNPFAEYELLECYYVNGSVRYGSANNTDKPYMRFWVLRSSEKDEAKRLLGYEGVDWRPSVLRIGEDAFGGYPLTMAMDALTAATFGNTIGKHGMIASARMVQPPKIVARSLREQIQKNRLNPDSNTYVDDATKEKVEYLTQKIDPSYIEVMLDRHNDVVSDRFYIPFFEMLTRMRDGSPPTATQIREMLGEKIGQLNPVIEAVEDDSLEPNVDKVWMYENDAGRMPEPPAELYEAAVNGDVKILNRYNGQLARLRRVLRANQGVIEALAIIKEFKEIAPTSLVVVKFKKLLEKALTNRVGQEMIFDEAEIAEIEAEIAAVEEQQRSLEAAEKMSKVIPSVTKDAVNPQSPAALAMAG